MHLKTIAIALAIASGLSLSALASDKDRLARFEGGIGSQPFRSTAGAPAPNAVQGVNPGGAPWVIAALSADSRIAVAGRGLLLGGGNGVGTTGGQSVRARLFCGAIAHDSALVPLDPAGDFRIDDFLLPAPPSPCDSPVLLIVNGGGAWFAAGIPKLPGRSDD
jgi:hypothetical protein